MCVYKIAMIRIKSLLLQLVLIVLFSPLNAQESALHIDEDEDYRKGMELLQKEKYSTAQQLFQVVFEKYRNEPCLTRTMSQYYIAFCAVRLFNEDAEYLTFKFVGENPESPLVNEAYFNLAGYFYARKRWRYAIDYYQEVDPEKLDRDKSSEYYFKLGYSYFSSGDAGMAKPLFYRIKDVNTKYTPPALYYYSHIHYQEENYQTALNGFLKLTGDKTFGPIAPYYIVQIYYKQGRYDEIVKFAPGIMHKVTNKRLDEVARITAEAFSQLGRYSESLPYYQTYLDSADYVRKEDKYQAGYAFYKAGEYSDAVTILGEISSTDSQLGQNAAYYLADCYLHMNDKQNARLAFQSASRGTYDPAIRQDALFNYALLCYELGNDPFNEAIRAFEDFIKQYPGSKRINEAYRFLVQSYLNAKNYKQAFESLEKSDLASDELKQAYQRIAFFRGIELYNNQQYAPAVSHFDKSLKYGNFDKVYKARALYWKAEAQYRMKNYTEAVSSYEAFKNAQVAYTLEEYDRLEYNIGYAYFKQKNYPKAIESLRKFSTEAPESMAQEKADALTRIGDCYYAQSQYYSAGDFYGRAAASGPNADYAMLQKALCEGLENRDIQKIQILQDLISRYPGSDYRDDAYFEMAQSYLKIQNDDRAIEKLKMLVSENSESPYAPTALVQTGLLYYNRNDNEEAIRYFKQTINSYPGTQAAKDALFGLKNIYVDMNRVDDYFAYTKNLGQAVPVITGNEQDSLSYLSAEKIYMTGDCKESSKAFERYIKNFPGGDFLLNAHFYKGDCNYQMNEYDKALESFSYILSKSKNMYTEQALQGASRIEMGQKNYQKAIEHYNQLAAGYSTPGNTKEARIGIMRANFALKNYEEALKASRTVSTLSKLSPEVEREATYVAARCLEESGRDALALEEYQKISNEVMSIEGAEAKYKVAQIQFDRGNLSAAEKEILDFSEKSSPHEYWIARSFILWADIFARQKEYFQAIQTLQSIVDFYEKTDDGILEMAGTRKARFVALQEANEKPVEGDDVNINIE
jgi:TolA-binding protein